MRSISLWDFRYRKRRIFLLCLFNAQYFVGSNRQAILERIVADVKTLEVTGLKQPGTDVRVHGSVALLIADNLAVHQVAGLTESFGKVQRVSRCCCCSCRDIQVVRKFSQCKIRSREEYDCTVRELKAKGFPDKLCSKEGIRSECALNQLKDFHVVDSTPPDLAHDILEGVLPVVISAVLTDIVKRKLTTLSDINQAIVSFPYSGRDKINPPQPVAHQGLIRCKQTAAEGFTLLRLLPLMLGCNIPQGDKVWNVLLKFVTLVRLSFSVRYTETDLEHYQTFIESWLSDFFQTFPDISVKPKFHFLLHYPDQVRKHGALSKITTLPYERKNQQLKAYSKVTKNFKCIAKSIATRHQEWMATKMREEHFFSWKTSLVQGTVSERELPPHSDVSEFSTRATVRGTAYGKNDVIAFTLDGKQRFGQIRMIRFSLGDVISFQCDLLETVRYEDHIAAYRVKRTGQVVTVEHRSLLDHHPLPLYVDQFVVGYLPYPASPSA